MNYEGSHPMPFEFPKDTPLFVDGGMGTQLQARGLKAGEKPELWNLSRPEVMREIHYEYAAAGASIMTSNTFGANRLKYPEGGAYALEDIIRAGIENARIPGCYVAFDLGPTGKLLEPLGSLAFEDAVAIYREMGMYAAEAGANLFFLETFCDMLEIKAAVVGLKEAAPEMPIFASFTVEGSGRLLTGGSPAAAAVMLEGLGVAALGLNCGEGPERAIQLLPEILAVTSVPVIAQPNAGLPVMRGGRACYDLPPEEYARRMAELHAMGASVLGGCCGTTPAHIRATAGRCKGGATRPLLPCEYISGTAKVAALDENLKIGTPDIAAYIGDEDWEGVADEALDLADEGADVIALRTDHMEAMVRCVEAVQMVCPLPLRIESGDPAVMEAGLRRCQGKPMKGTVS